MPSDKKLLFLQDVANDVVALPGSAGFIKDGKEYLNLSENEPLILEPFETLIKEKAQTELPFILAVLTTKSGNTHTHTYYEATRITFSMFDLDTTLEEPKFKNNRYEDYFKQFKEPFVRSVLEKEIRYFIIKDLNSLAQFWATDYDLLQNTNKIALQKQFFDYSPEVILKKAEKYKNEGNKESAEKYYKLAADQNNLIAQHALATLYYKEGNVKEAKKYYTLAADQNNPVAQNSLAAVYLKEGNFEEAKKYFKLAADQNYPAAQNALANLYYKEGNVQEAKKYYTLAADQNNPTAQYNLAALYEKEGNIQEAKKYYKLAADQKDENAKKELERLGKPIIQEESSTNQQ